MVGLIGRKLGMTQVYNDKEELIPVTIVAAGPCPVVQVKTQQTDGYGAVQLAFDEVPARKVNKPGAGQFAKAGVAPHRMLREFRTEGVDGDLEVGQVLDVSQFEAGDTVKVTGRSKGKGFAGVVKRYLFHGKNATHGTPDRVRAPGSIGQGTTPGKVWKGKKMPGQMGNKNVTTRGIEVVRIDGERNLLFLKGAIPGAGDGLLVINRQ
ncbi:MAG TPA: 50S ribosomal protein L3 [Candidatus Latescibacteria bacterium]|jgi:large subunit ribosomal protein L3|nr:50S ribosomal protein L3 [Gemmatimonadaceae bacterium]MDP6017773.1 50S ribosomal protein L3 [Candidatus Latescibacterota bacterium]HJP32973.1 50S ribosomal protein L3 [Candidatus Latescibacterota bacterium]|tara:strand:+ start:385 stop:1008 length:624 start_codon:yes stop_codon:yes gene_type:complete